jgi:hypothetical protein
MPPYVMSQEDLAELCNGMLLVLERYFLQEHGQTIKQENGKEHATD